MNKNEILDAFIRSGRLNIIPVGFTGEEREGEGDEDKHQG
jgi:hypothetical protein